MPRLQTLLVIALVFLWAAGANGAQVNPPASGFSVTGYIQEATLDATVGVAPASPRLAGGYLTVNGIKMIVPNNSIVQTPAGTFSWADLFDPAVSASVGYNPPRPNHRADQTGLALTDASPLGTRASVGSGAWFPYPAFSVSVVGNIVTQPDGSQKYIVGLIVPAEQLPLMGGAGLINFIDYDGTVLPGNIPGRFRVGGILNDPTTGTLCEINDPVGRFGAAHSPDPRFTCDTDNPTIVAASGYPVGIPTVAPPAIDPDRPLYNRPLNDGTFAPVDPFIAATDPLRNFTMPFKAAPNAPGVTTPDPWKQAPLMVGDWIDYGGTLFKISPLGPNTAANTFVSIHTISAHLGIRTALGTQPAYIAVEGFLFGVGDRVGGPTQSAGNPLTPIAQETSTRVSMVSFTTNTDPNLLQGDPRLPNAEIRAIDTQFGTGTNSVFPVIDPTQFTMDDPIRGRIRFQDASNNPKPPVSGTLYNATGPGNFYRMYQVRLTGPGSGILQLPPQSNGLPGLNTGQFSLPIFEYLFGEGSVFGQPIPPFNFWNFGFLTTGDGLYNGGPQIGPLNPFPGPITQPLAPQLARATGGTATFNSAAKRGTRLGLGRR